ncbi:hypothetical protein [Streptacidiphilus cavernicola]|uniref:ApeA N-terminal domain-containing protein n=1 Tax=Streptacidiphilus cavernicola TaxID=3342716 RepID=A0ABV6VPX7_9ACTN
MTGDPPVVGAVERIVVVGIAPDDDDFEDDWDDGGSWYEDPTPTYREAVESLRDLVKDRTDVQVHWQGGRGVGGNARIVFMDAGGLTVRLGSALQVDGITRMIGSAAPLPGHHAVWYHQQKVIRARLVGDYDQLHSAVAQEMGGGRARPVRPDSGLARDVAGMLAQSGVFSVSREPGAAGDPALAIRLVSVPQELTLLYRVRAGDGAFPALELSGVSATDQAAAERTLVVYGTSYLFGLGKATGVSLRLWNAEHRIGSRWEASRPRRLRFPGRQYDDYPAELYSAGNSLARDPAERYLKYYQVLEFYMRRAMDTAAAAQGAAAAKAVSPFRRKELTTEQGALDAVIDLAVTRDQLVGFLKGPDLFATLSDPRVIKEVPALERDQSGGPVASQDPRGPVSERVYTLRNRIVHMKEGGGGLRKPMPVPAEGLLSPFGREARELSADLRLVRFLAERALEHWSTPLA